jgi:hypothetical protein
MVVDDEEPEVPLASPAQSVRLLKALSLSALFGPVVDLDLEPVRASDPEAFELVEQEGLQTRLAAVLARASA